MGAGLAEGSGGVPAAVNVYHQGKNISGARDKRARVLTTRTKQHTSSRKALGLKKYGR